MSSNRVRVKIPRNMEQLTKLMESIVAKNAADGPSSPINSVINPTVDAAIITLRQDVDRLVQMRKDAEALTESVQTRLGIRKGQKLSQRDSARFIATAVRNILMGIYQGQEQMLGEWGFVVDYSPRKKQQENPDA